MIAIQTPLTVRISNVAEHPGLVVSPLSFNFSTYESKSPKSQLTSTYLSAGTGTGPGPGQRAAVSPRQFAYSSKRRASTLQLTDWGSRRRGQDSMDAGSSRDEDGFNSSAGAAPSRSTAKSSTKRQPKDAAKPKPLPNASGTRFQCPRCPKNFSRIENLTRHQANRKSANNTFPCRSELIALQTRMWASLCV